MDIYLQLFWNSFMISAVYAVIAVSFTLIYSVTRVLHVAHGGVVLAGGYLFYFGLKHGLGMLLSVILAMGGSALLGLLVSALLYETLRRRRTLTGTAGMLTSVGAMIIIQYTLLALWGSRTIVIHTALERLPFWQWRSVVFTSLSVLCILVSIALLLFCFFLLKKTSFGSAMRATADNEELAEVVGIDTKRIRTFTVLLCSSLAGISGILTGLLFHLDPTRAVGYAVDAFSIAIIGGLGSIPGSIIAAFFYMTFMNLGGFWVTAGIKTLFAFMVACVFLLLRPQGIFGKKRA